MLEKFPETSITVSGYLIYGIKETLQGCGEGVMLH